MNYPKFDFGEQRGSITLIFSLAFCILFSCDTTRRAGADTPEPGDITNVEEEIDTDSIQGKPLPVDTMEIGDVLPEEAEGEAGTEKRSEIYDVVLMLPFLTNRFQGDGEDLHRISRWSLNFYGGVQLAIDKLRQSDLRMRLSVLDTEGSEEKVEKMLSDRLNPDSTDLVIGPYRRVNIQMVAEYGKRNDIIVVSPYSATSNLTENNPNFIQVRPSLETHCNALIRHALKRHDPGQLVLIGQDEALDRRSLHLFQEAYFTWAGTRYTDSLTQMTFGNISEDLENEELQVFLEGRDTTVFVVSAWNAQDESFVYTFLRKLELARQPEQVIEVYGTPVWQEYDRIDMDYFEKMNIHISSHIFIDPTSPEIRQFRRDYFNRFGNLPTEESYLGFDIMLYFGRMLEEYGDRFQLDLEKESANGLHTRFAFERVVESAMSAEENPVIEQFANKYVHILKFEDYQFKVLNLSAGVGKNGETAESEN